MDLSTFIMTVFCLIDDQLEGRHIRQHGSSLKLSASDAEVLTIEIIGESLGMDTKGYPPVLL